MAEQEPGTAGRPAEHLADQGAGASGWQWLAGGGVCSPLGYRAGATACGLKASGRDDLALLALDRPAAAAGLFTRSALPAAPVLLDRERLAGPAAAAGGVRGVVVNAGVANACTGEGGLEDARAMGEAAAAALVCRPEQVLVLSTGVIGRRLDMGKVRHGIRGAAARLRPDGGSELARAIMTTDTVSKEAAVELRLAGGTVRLGAAAKGAGMIHPDMATLLAVVTTDAALGADDLAALLLEAADASFNRISVDGDTSTNDSLLLLANGAGGVTLESAEDRAAFAAALTALCRRLALAVVRDGEGARRLAAITVRGAASRTEALAAARCIATSPLVKTALAGGDPNWGRILAAAARSGARLDAAGLRLALACGDGEGKAVGPWLTLVEGGVAASFAETEAAALLAGSDVCFRLDLGLGDAQSTVWTCDLTADYVSINADYTT